MVPNFVEVSGKLSTGTDQGSVKSKTKIKPTSIKNEKRWNRGTKFYKNYWKDSTGKNRFES